MFARLKLIVAALVATAVILSATPASAGTTSGFGDVPEDTYFTTPIAWLVEAGITTGLERGCFGPSDSVTRGQVAAFLFRLDLSLGNNPIAGENPFDDVTASYQIGPVGWMAASNITTGTSPTTYEPEAPITRGDFATLLWRYAEQPLGDPQHPFTDVTAGYQHAAISWMKAHDITTGTSPTTFNPNGLVTRAEAATFLFRFVAPGAVAPATTSSDCDRSIRNALVAAGMTIEEAKCAAPLLAGFSVDFLTQAVAGEVPFTPALLDALVTIQSNGCLTAERVVEFIQVYF